MKNYSAILEEANELWFSPRYAVLSLTTLTSPHSQSSEGKTEVTEQWEQGRKNGNESHDVSND